MNSKEIAMRCLPVLLVAIALPFAATAKDRAVTHEEHAKLEVALKEQGCSGGKLEFDDDKAAAHPNGKFEVDEATCQDGKKYDLTFDPAFKLLTKKLD
jgi:hypothetical protein